MRGMLLAIVAALVLAPAAAAQPSVREPRMVQLDGHAMRVLSVGLEQREHGKPVVVFEAGAYSSLDTWRPVIEEIAKHAPVVAYDRSGLGKSDWDEVRPTPRHVTSKLRRLLKLVGADPPYVLVGHSWGGMLAHYYAGYHPTDVAGLVFVDPAPVLTQELRGNFAPFEAIGAKRSAYNVYWDRFAALLTKASPAARAEFEVFRGLNETERAKRDLSPLPRAPVVVLVAAKYLHLPFFEEFPFDARRHFEADLRHRVGLLKEWALASDDGMLVVSRGTTHAIPREDPRLIATSIQYVLERSRGRR